jgi:voltage-gated potassium channel
MKFQKWSEKTTLLSLALSLIYTVAYVVPIYFNSIPSEYQKSLRDLNLAIWVYFAVDFVILFLASDLKRSFIRKHFLDLLMVALPFFRVLRGLRALLFAGRATLRNTQNFLKYVPWLFGIGALLMILVMGAAVLEVERYAPGAKIVNAPDALWWAFTTVTTIGYGDVYPVTTEGRLITGILIIFGVTMVSTLTATFAAWILTQTKTKA